MKHKRAKKSDQINKDDVNAWWQKRKHLFQSKNIEHQNIMLITEKRKKKEKTRTFHSNKDFSKIKNYVPHFKILL